MVSPPIDVPFQVQAQGQKHGQTGVILASGGGACALLGVLDVVFTAFGASAPIAVRAVVAIIGAVVGHGVARSVNSRGER